MALEKTKNIDQITVTENGHVLYREAIRIVEDGEVLSTSYHRTTLEPGQDLTGQPENVVAIAQAAWTPEVIAAYNTQLQTTLGQ